VPVNAIGDLTDAPIIAFVGDLRGSICHRRDSREIRLTPFPFFLSPGFLLVNRGISPHQNAESRISQAAL
jgi:hypothetical protein